MHNTSATEVIREFHNGRVANFGSPSKVYVDNGTNFTSREFKEYAHVEGFEFKKSVQWVHVN